MKFRAFLLIILFFQYVTQGLTFAATEIDLSQEGEVNITSSFSYHSGSENFPSDFTPIKESEFHHSYTSKNIWLLGRFKNESSFPVEKIIYLSSLTIGDLVFYKKVLGEWKEFEKFEIHKDRDRLGFFPKFHLSLGSNDEMEVLIKRQGLHHLDTKILLTDANSLNKLEKKTERLYTFYLGFVVALALFNLVIFVLTKDKNYLIYTVFIMSIGLLILSLVGAIDGIYINKQLNKNIGSFSSISIALAFFFSYRFLRLKQKVPKAKYFFIPCVCTSVIIVLINQTYLYAEYTNI
ncbi:7TM diverse intracellular signaling domain protein [Bacteriovorax sp. DB6_IX]|nr:7TM diverse intracellular signaling domain protein [Bacteriovorax sp. DB6_IX]